MQYLDRIVDVPVVVQRRVPTIQAAQKTEELPQVQFLDRVMGSVPTIQTVQQTVEVPEVQFPDRAADVPVSMQRQVPQEQIMEGIVEEADVPVPYVKEEMIEVAQHGLQEHVQKYTVELAVDVPVRVIMKIRAEKRLDMLAEIVELNDDRKKFYEA